MDEIQKNTQLKEAKMHVLKVSDRILSTKKRIDTSIMQLRKELIHARGEERDTKEVLLYLHLDTQRNMDQQHASPYFVRCDVKFDDETEQKTLYFGRFPYIAESTYSWIAPAAVIRFNSPGRFLYETPSGEKRSGWLIRKDQFLIVDGKILFMSTESDRYPRELIYQEYFSEKKNQFMLKEIVEQMEKAQDTIIRSHYFGSFLISGPAGSGKTTLALHRAAFLIQSPDTAELFPAKDIIVFVHDSITKQYFSSLLPQLGIHKVTITTFHEWARDILGLPNTRFVLRYGTSEHKKDIYEYAKNQALKNLKTMKLGKDIYKVLHETYKDYFSEEQLVLLANQKQRNVLDRFDLTVLLRLSMLEKGRLHQIVEKYVKLMNGKYVKKIMLQPVIYSLIVLDEAENYLSEQISLIKSSINSQTNGLIYVGDLIQRTLPFTISNWEEVYETFETDRKVVLQKVYRNTKQILSYIQSLGYPVTIPDQVKEGRAVEECIVDNKQSEIKKIISVIENKKDEVIGVLAKSEEYLQQFKRQLSAYKNIHVLTINEAQGVEFDVVFLVGMHKKSFNLEGLPENLQEERKKVDRDLVYVALTRAISELYVLGNTYLKLVLST